MTVRNIITVLSLFFLSACVTDGQKTINGTNLGQSNWKEIPIEESKLKAPAQIVSFVNKVEMNSLPSRRQEKITFKRRGRAFMEWLYSAYFPSPVSDTTFRSMFAGTQLHGKTLMRNELVVHKKNGLRYSIIDRTPLQCIAFSKGLGRIIQSGREAYVRGIVCNKKGNTSFVDTIITDLDKVYFER